MKNKEKLRHSIRLHYAHTLVAHSEASCTLCFVHIHLAFFRTFAANTPVVSPPSQTVDVGVPARFECNVPGNDDAELHWRKEDGSPLGYGVTDEHGVLTFSNVQPSDAGAYVCSAEATEGEGAIDSSPAYLNINPTERMSYALKCSILILQASIRMIR